MSRIASVVVLAIALASLLPRAASAQATSTPPATSSSTAPASDAASEPATPPPARTEETRSEVGGSTARITRGGDPTTAPVRSTRDGEDEETPIHEEDDGRKADFIWLEVDGGISYVDLVALQQENFATPEGVITTPSFEAVRGWGPTVGVGFGFRIFFLAIGARATFASYPGFDVGTVGGEVQLRLPTPVVEPWIRVGAGYAWQGNANYAMPTASTPTVYGWMLNASLGLDVFLTWWFSLGIGGGVDFLNMTRQSDPRVMCEGVAEFCPSQSGDAIGVQARGIVQAGLHF